MANTKISALTSGSPAQAGDLIPIDRAGANFSISVNDVLQSSFNLQKNIPVSAAQIKDLLANPVVLIASPGAGKVIVPTQIQIGYTFGGTPFSSPTSSAACNGAFNVAGTLAPTLIKSDEDAAWTAAGGSFTGLTSLLTTAVANANTVESDFIDTGNAPLEQLAGLGLLLINSGAIENFNAGNGSLKFTITYNIITLV